MAELGEKTRLSVDKINKASEALVARSASGRRSSVTLAGCLLLLFLLSGCGPGRDGRVSIRFDRADSPAHVRVERHAGTAEYEQGVAIGRVSGEFLVERVTTIVEPPYETALWFVSATGEEFRILLDHEADAPPPVESGELVNLRYAGRTSRQAREWCISIRSADGELLFLAVQRHPRATAFEDEAALPDALRLQPLDDRVYLETMRRESYCTAQLRHLVAKLGTKKDDTLIRPGESLLVELSKAVYRVHLADLVEEGEAECTLRERSLLAYEITRTEGHY